MGRDLLARSAIVVLWTLLWSFSTVRCIRAFTILRPQSLPTRIVEPTWSRSRSRSRSHTCAATCLSMSFVSEGSDYSSKDSDYEDSGIDDYEGGTEYNRYDDDDDSPTDEEQPVPLSKNAGSRFLAVWWHREVLSSIEGIPTRTTADGRVVAVVPTPDTHDVHDALIQDHIMFCRKANLYNETFNYNSMADIVWSYPLLSSDNLRIVGHAMCIDANEVEYVHDLLRREPILTGVLREASDGEVDSNMDVLAHVHLFRWRHIKDASLRWDSGRFGVPTLYLGLRHDDEKEDASHQKRRDEVYDDHLRYLIRSERVVMAGPLHRCTNEKNDPQCVPLGDLVIVNIEGGTRENAIAFAEADPLARAGLYEETFVVHGFCDLDMSGKFITPNYFDIMTHKKDQSTMMREALESLGYPVGDRQTPWINH